MWACCKLAGVGVCVCVWFALCCCAPPKKAVRGPVSACSFGLMGFSAVPSQTR
ncbi:hypothetical protein COCSADRAFT_176177 [Bipolaris sorokiniana ND90Pr]|uniref:Uncharacterized protein n=1 Tax=Cochliobolus sativus (strain ND90Pr / ATCC 201652) TaxID=665912 RepID=M2S8N4_COCSN|nr:uncharacterized protein COCSADRAFT_176177 [Bipolaris sorokiniana ND90Pr]EMD58940.1 hypothetical protein COCSADRAFT_176177 [Bipolaris sorokiniana ND90Pr]